jgi:predicted glycogen debranching enzyme
MVPNRFPDHGTEPEFNSVDASLWYLVAVHALLGADDAIGAADRARLLDAIAAILDGYERGTRHGIRADEDGLLAAGEPGVQLTWMDAKVDDWVVTPRIGKPVEVEALWINALRIGADLLEAGGGRRGAANAERAARWRALHDRALAAFAERFWNEERGILYDVIDVDHVRGRIDATFRANQIFAVGGLPFALLDGARARRVVDAVEARLVTPLGLRTLAADEPGYFGRYEGGVRARDAAYHNGTVWPWLLGPFVEAWVRVRGETRAAKSKARERFLAPLLARGSAAGIDHIAEIADGDAPHTPRGCPFQAWSLAEAIRLDRAVLAGGERARPRRRAR